jgi:hypothetical protein
MVDRQTKFQREFFDKEKDLIPFLRERGLTKGLGPSDPDVVRKYIEDHNNALNDYAVMVNARDRKLTLFDALHNLLTRKIRQEAHKKGFDSTLK